jgi:hypothetical protein
MTWVIVFAIIGGFVCGGVLSFILFFVIHVERISYHSKRECHECLRRKVESGFYSDGKRYECVEKGE